MTQAPSKYSHYLTDFDADSRRLASQPAWLSALRKEALAHFREVGLPTARSGNEPWKYTNVAPIAAAQFVLEATPEPDIDRVTAVAPWCTVWHEAVFVNGRYSPALSASPATHEPREGLGGATIESLADAIARDDGLIERHLSRLVPYDYDGFTALNTAFLADGAFVYVPDGAEVLTHIHLLFISAPAARPGVSYPRTLIVSGRSSKVTVIESYVSLNGAQYLNDAVSEIFVGEGARVEHYRVLLDRDAYHVGVTRVDQGRDSSFTSTSYATGAALARNDFAVTLGEPGAECRLRGLYVGAGTQHIDNYLNIDHAAPHCKSRLYYKGILDEKSRAVFGGTVLVRPGAIKTDSHQEDKNLVLSHEAEVDSKPALEIYADDVKCGHGATAGALTDEALFYMRSRGIDETTANQLLIKAFASEILDETIEPLREYLERRTAEALPRFGMAQGMS